MIKNILRSHLGTVIYSDAYNQLLGEKIGLNLDVNMMSIAGIEKQCQN